MSGRCCPTVQDTLGALIAAHLQTVVDLTWMRYQLARLEGDDAATALGHACDLDRITRSLEPLKHHGLDVDGFVADVIEAVRIRVRTRLTDPGRSVTSRAS